MNASNPKACDEESLRIIKILKNRIKENQIQIIALENEIFISYCIYIKNIK